MRVAPDSPAAPEVERRLTAAKAARVAAQATIAIRTTPPGAEARLPSDPDGAACVTPCELRTDPGPASLVLTLGDASRTLTQSLSPSARWDVEETLVIGATGPDERPPVKPPPAVDRTGPIVAFSVGGAALVTGVVFGVMASGDHSDGKALADRGPLTPAEQRTLAGLRDDVESKSLAADISFGLAAAGAVVGTVLWLTAEAPAPEASTTTSAPAMSLGAGGAAWRF